MKHVALLCLLLLIPFAGADASQVRSVSADVFFAPEPADVETDTGCGGGSWRIDGDRLHFREAPENGPPSVVPGQDPGFTTTACGSASVSVPVPEGALHLHVRFHAERIVNQFPEGSAVNTLEEVRVFADDRLISTIPLRASDAPSVPDTAFDLDAIALPFGASELRVVWYYEDHGSVEAVGQTPPVTSGVSLEAYLHNINLELSGAEVQHRIDAGADRQGTLVQDRTAVVATIDDEPGAAPALRVRVAPGLQFQEVVLPDGNRTSDVATIEQATIPGFDIDIVQLERHPDFTQVTLPAEFLARHGPGEYQVVFTSVEVVEVVPALIPLVVLLFLLPVPFAALAFFQARRFEREAFGGYKRTARNLRYGVVAVLLYYALVVVGSLLSGRLDLMTTWPMPAEAWFSYLQVVVAGLAFLVLWSVARAMVAIIKPDER